MDRPFRSPVGMCGAIVCLVLCAGTLASIVYIALTKDDYLIGLIMPIVVMGFCIALREATWEYYSDDVSVRTGASLGQNSVSLQRDRSDERIDAGLSGSRIA